jgi:hypothetical protein
MQWYAICAPYADAMQPGGHVRSLAARAQINAVARYARALRRDAAGRAREIAHVERGEEEAAVRDAARWAQRRLEPVALVDNAAVHVLGGPRGLEDVECLGLGRGARFRVRVEEGLGSEPMVGVRAVLTSYEQICAVVAGSMYLLTIQMRSSAHEPAVREPMYV